MTKLIQMLLLLFFSFHLFAQNTAYCNIESVTTTSNSNSMLITIKSDGLLTYQRDFGDSGNPYQGSNGQLSTKILLHFPNAKSKLKQNLIRVDQAPLSYLQFSVPQTTKEGIGIDLVVTLSQPAITRVSASSDFQTVYITVDKNHSSAANSVITATTGTEVAGSMSVDIVEGKLSIHALKAKLHPLLAMVAKKGEIDIAIDDSIQGREVTLSLEGLSAPETIQAVAAAYGLALQIKDGIYSLSNGSLNTLSTYRLSSTESFPMKFTRAKIASELLPSFIYSYLQVNQAQNSVVITAPAQMLEKIQSDFKKIDIAPDQIMIEAMALELATTEDLNTSLGLSYLDSGTTAAIDTGTGDISFKTTGGLPTDFQAKLKALISKGKARILANPRMAAVNGQDADIFIGQTKFIKVSLNSYGGVQQQEIRGIDVGVKLAVTPWTGKNGEITVKIKPEVSNISEQERDTGLPVLSTRRADTTVRVKDGETIIIGGLTQLQDYKTHTKIPGFGDMPFIGHLFRGLKTSRVKSELVILITPHILTDRGRLNDEAKEKAIRDKMGR